MKKTNIAEKYLTQQMISVPDLVCIGIMIVGFILISFVHHGGTAGVIVLFAGIAGLVFVRASRVSDASFDNEVKRLLRDHDLSATEPGTLTAYDLTRTPVVKGHDGAWRSSVFILTKITVANGQCHARWYEADLIARTVRENQLTVDLPANIYVTEKELIIKDKGNVMTQGLHFPDGTSIPITTSTMAFEIVKKKLRLQ